MDHTARSPHAGHHTGARAKAWSFLIQWKHFPPAGGVSLEPRVSSVSTRQQRHGTRVSGLAVALTWTSYLAARACCRFAASLLKRLWMHPMLSAATAVPKECYTRPTVGIGMRKKSTFGTRTLHRAI